MLLCDKYFCYAQLFPMDTCTSLFTCFWQNTHSWVYTLYRLEGPKYSNIFETIRLNDHQLTSTSALQFFLPCLFLDVVLPCNLLQSRSWQAQGNSHRDNMRKNKWYKGWIVPLLLVWCIISPLKAAKIPLGIELGINEFHFNDFSLDNDAMITASLRMFLDLGAVQKFKIDYEVRQESCVAQNKRCVPCKIPEWPCSRRFCAAGFSL